MKILYHHRTRATDAQRVHILEIVQAFRSLGAAVEIASIVDTEVRRSDAAHEAGQASWKSFAGRVPFAYEVLQLAYNLFAIPWLLLKIIRFKPDLVYERYCLFNCAGVIAARLSRRPLVLEVNSPFALEQSMLGEIRARGLAQWMEKVICNMAERVIVVSRPLYRIMHEAGVHDSRLMIMSNGANLAHLSGDGRAAALRQELQLEGKVVIGFAGWFRPWHGLEFLIETFAQFRLYERGAVLLFVGDGPAMAGLRDLVQQTGASDVVFTGPIPHEQMPAYLHVMDIAVQPAANQYCCPMKILEYMGTGKPIVAPRQENIQDLLSEGTDCILFDPGDRQDLASALERLIEQSELRTDLGRAAYDTLMQRGFLWERNAQRIIDLARKGRELEHQPHLGS